MLLGGYIVLQATVLSRSQTSYRVAFWGPAQALRQPLTAAAEPLGVHILSSSVPDLATGRSEVVAGSLDALVSGQTTSPRVDVKNDLDPTLQAALQNLAREAALNGALANRGVDPAPVDQAVLRAGLQVTALDPSGAQRAERAVAGIFVAVLLYVALLMYGQIVALGVVEEKSNRIVEILLSTIRPRHLLFGKVIGIGLVGLSQLVLLGAVALLVDARFRAISVPGVGVATVIGGLAWFVLGFLLYGFLYAAAGSLVSRQEDLGSVLAPVSVLVVGTYLTVFWLLANPDLPAAQALSVVPMFAPILMPVRIAAGDLPAWQLLMAGALTVASIALLNAIASRIYTNSVLRTGAKVGWRQAWAGRD